jgi:hypothetical protein
VNAKLKRIVAGQMRRDRIVPQARERPLRRWSPVTSGR